MGKAMMAVVMMLALSACMADSGGGNDAPPDGTEYECDTRRRVCEGDPTFEVCRTEMKRVSPCVDDEEIPARAACNYVPGCTAVCREIGPCR